MYKQQVLKILMDVGESGMSASLLSKHVYNMNTTLFFQPDVDEIRRWVWSYLQRNARSKHALVEHTGRHGFYRLNKRGVSYMRKQMLAQQERDDSQERETETVQPAPSPGLFD